MGAETFKTVAFGKDATDAFWAATERAAYMHGHGGYTGTIAEKDRFMLIPLPPGIAAETYAETLIENRDSRVDDKWGPAGCIEIPVISRGCVLSEHRLGDRPDLRLFLFFGWASS